MTSKHLLPGLSLCCVTLAGCGASPIPSDVEARSDEMLNGTPRSEALPYVILQQQPGGIGSDDVCSGLAISTNWVLTAEHCFRAARTDSRGVAVSNTTQARAPIFVRVGSSAANTLAEVSQQVRFPNGDLMLLRMTDPLPSTLAPSTIDSALDNALPAVVGDSLECWTSGPATETATGGAITPAPRRGSFRVIQAGATRFALDQSDARAPRLVHGDSGAPCFKTGADGRAHLVGVVSNLSGGTAILSSVVAFAPALRGAASVELGAKSSDGDGDGMPDLFFRKDPMEDPLTALRPDRTRVLGEWRFASMPALANVEACSRASASRACEPALDVTLRPATASDLVPAAPWQVLGLAEFGAEPSDTRTSANRSDLVLWDDTTRTLAFARRRLDSPQNLVASSGGRSTVRVDASANSQWALSIASGFCGDNYDARPVVFGRFAGHPGAVLVRKDRANLCIVTLAGTRLVSSFGEFLSTALRPGEELKSFTDFDGDGNLDFAFESPVIDASTKQQLKTSNVPVWKLCFRTFDSTVRWDKLVDAQASKDTRCTQLVPGQRVLGAMDVDLDGRAEILVQDPTILRAGVLGPTIPKLPGLSGMQAIAPAALALSPIGSTAPIGSLGSLGSLVLGPRPMTNRGVVSARILAFRVQRGTFNGEQAMLTLDDSAGTAAVPHPYVLGTPPAGMVLVAP